MVQGRTAPPCRRLQRGVTLVELIMFIVIASVIAIAMVQVFSGTLQGSHQGKEMTQATQLAQQRMEIILGQRKELGYSTFIASANYDPCKSGAWTAELCTSVASYTVDSTAPASCGTDCRQVTVTVTGPSGNLLATLTEQFWDY